MKVAFYLTPGRKKNLYCRINDAKDRITFSLEYAVDPQKWNSKKEILDDDDVNYYTLLEFKNYLSRKYHLLKTDGKENILNLLKNEAETLMANKGLEGVAKSLFDLENKPLGVPAFDDFIKAFEKYSSLKRDQYKAQPLDESIHFHTNDEIYVMDTYQGLKARLKGYIERESYDEIYTQTESWIWREIYVDTGIERHKFMPRMLSEWEVFWSEKYKRVKEEIGRTEHLDQMKAQSWRGMQVFMECYNDSGDIIELAEDVDEMDLYPISIITMLSIFDADTCYSEYCEYEFEQPDIWNSISLEEDGNETDYDGPIFYIKTYEL